MSNFVQGQSTLNMAAIALVGISTAPNTASAKGFAFIAVVGILAATYDIVSEYRGDSDE